MSSLSSKTISQSWTNYACFINRELFVYAAISWLILSVLEIIWPKIVLAYFNLNYLLFFLLATGCLTLIWPPADRQPKQSNHYDR